MCYNSNIGQLPKLPISYLGTDMTNVETKAEARSRVLRLRQENKLAQKLFPIAANQAKLIAAKSGIAYDLLYAEGLYAIAKIVKTADPERIGFWRYSKMCVSGYMYNFVRDKSRAVRTPRPMSVLYLAEQAAIKANPDLRHAPVSERARLLGVTESDLNEARAAVNFYTDTMDYHDASYDAGSKTSEEVAEEELADLALEVIDAGIRFVAAKSKVGTETVANKFRLAIEKLINDKAAELQSGG